MLPSRAVLAVLAGIALFVTGCGGADDVAGGSAGSSEGEATASPDEGTVAETDPETSESGSTGTLVLADGTEITFEMSTCDTSDTDPDVFLVDPGYNLFGTSDDGYRLQVIRAGLDEEGAGAIGSLEADFDENGVNPAVAYTAIGDENVLLDVDGAHVTGTMSMTSLDPGAPLGPSIEATADITC